MRKSLLFAALIAALALLLCGGTLANTQEEEAVAQTSGDVGQFKASAARRASLNDPIVKPYHDDPHHTPDQMRPDRTRPPAQLLGQHWSSVRSLHRHGGRTL